MFAILGNQPSYTFRSFPLIVCPEAPPVSIRSSDSESECGRLCFCFGEECPDGKLILKRIVEENTVNI